MPEYLSPGVYIEETSYRSKSIEGVSTSTAGFIGPARFGPISGEPELITSLADFIRIYGDLEDLHFSDLANPHVNYLAHGVRAFFEEGGRRLFVQRVFNAPGGFGLANDVPANHYATGDTLDGETTASDGFMLVARFPGRAGNVRITFQMRVSGNVFRLNTDGGDHMLSRLSNNTLVHVRDSQAAQTYTVADGDTFDSIATGLSTGDFTITAEELAAANDMDVEPEFAGGEELIIPGSTCTVSSGDTFETIETAFTGADLDVTAEDIAAANGMEVGDALSDGEMIDTPEMTYTASTGDTLPDIASDLNGLNIDITPEEIAEANDLTFLSAGETLDVPALYDAEGSANGLMIARRTPAGAWELYDNDPDAPGATVTMDLSAAGSPSANLQVRPVTLLVEVARPGIEPNTFGTPETLGEYSMIRTARNALLSTFTPNPESRFDALTVPFAIIPDDDDEAFSITLLSSLMGTEALDSLSTAEEDLTVNYTLTGGDDGALPVPNNYTGDPSLVDLTGDIVQMPLNGFLAFETVEDISIIASPGYTADRTDDQAFAIQNELINHCLDMQYRVAVLDTPDDQTVTEALNFRNLRSTTHAAMYYPWIVVADPRNSRNGQPLKLPPSGFLAGIYARNDNEHAVFKAPANEVVRLATNFEVQLTRAHQDLLNPNGVNCLRFFEGRGYLVWGARTISDDPEWKYISLRRYFAYLERSIDRSTQWAVFENNDSQLWGKIRRAVEDFLYNEWVSGGLLGDKPESAYFVRCDRSTMTQNDLDNGRLICLVGVAPVRPAEFVIFRIGQWTADSDR